MAAAMEETAIHPHLLMVAAMVVAMVVVMVIPRNTKTRNMTLDTTTRIVMARVDIMTQLTHQVPMVDLLTEEVMVVAAMVAVLLMEAVMAVVMVAAAMVAVHLMEAVMAEAAMVLVLLMEAVMAVVMVAAAMVAVHLMEAVMAEAAMVLVLLTEVDMVVDMEADMLLHHTPLHRTRLHRTRLHHTPLHRTRLHRTQATPRAISHPSATHHCPSLLSHTVSDLTISTVVTPSFRISMRITIFQKKNNKSPFYTFLNIFKPCYSCFTVLHFFNIF